MTHATLPASLHFVSTHAELLAKMLNWNTALAHEHCDDITTEESMFFPPDGGNNMNWTLGHITKYRGLMIERCGYEIPWHTEKYDRYKRHAAVLTDASEAISVQEMLADLDRSLKILLKWCETADAEELARPTEGASRTVGNLVGRLAWHECYHFGQLEIFRHLAGKHEPVFI